ncbi:glycosyltransferase family 2 protein [Thermoflexus sp.]|uniref:glycosyltransferase family 2 protein n=1 Tax=Thermoflexus sp. TaxID=1969742 RepID=UPI001776C13D|nr:glycosyltransferase [Thermoflexus sp.]
MKERITIILLTKNGERYLEEVMEGIFAQRVALPFEVLAIDSGSRDRSKEILNRYPVRLVEIPPHEFNHGETRNLGARLAHPDTCYLVYLSQDATPADEEWLNALIQPMQEDKQVAGVFSRHLPRPSACPSLVRQLLTRWQTGGTERLVKRMPASRADFEANRFFYIYFSNTSSAIRRSVWAQIPFRPLPFGEDADWAERVLLAGYALVFEPRSRVFHSHDYGLLELFRENADYAAAFRERFDPPAYRGFGLQAVLRGAIRESWEDWRFIWRHPHFREQPLQRRLFWMLYSPAWHLAVGLGTYCGIRGLPRRPKWGRYLSRQERVRRI